MQIDARIILIYVFIMHDKTNGSQLRETLRPDHRAYLSAVAERIAFAGPLIADDEKTILGSLIAIEFPDREAANEWLRNEPYTRGGVYESTQIHAFRNLWPQKAGFPCSVAINVNGYPTQA
jgi:uncharacterized protein YciI